MATKVTVRTLLTAIIFLFSVCLDSVASDRVKEKIYDGIQGDMACFKRFNGTHEIGCTSNFLGNIGVIHLIRNSSDLDWVYEKGPHNPYILAVTPDFMSVEVLSDAQKSGKVSGVVILVPEDFDPQMSLADGYSGEKTCPNDYLGLYNQTSNPEYSGYCSKQPWNPSGSSLLYTSWDFPIFIINNESSVVNIQTCYEQFNKPINGEPRPWPLCSLELKSHMFGTTNTEVCMRRASLTGLGGLSAHTNFCDPLSDTNVWGTMKPMNASDDLPDKSVIVVAARMDAATMFDNISPGAESAVSGFVALLSAAEALNRHREEIMSSPNSKNILFVIYQGETWGYIGSSRMVWDMQKGQFPFLRSEEDDLANQMSQINLTHIDYFIEVSQVGKMTNKRLYLHSDPISNSEQEIKDDTDHLVSMFNISSSLTGGVVFERAPKDMPLPPASFQSFLKYMNISGLVIADHLEEYNNKYYQSVLDNADNIQADNVNDVASVLATSLYLLVTGGSDSKKIEADKEFTEELLHCYNQNVSCQTFREMGGHMLKEEFFDNKPARLYVSVKRGEESRKYLLANIFAKAIGEEVDLNETECKAVSIKKIYQYYYLPHVGNGTCYRTTVRKTEAMSPAFLIDDYDWQSGEYSTWTESGWQSFDARLFLRPSVAEEVALVCGGVVSVVLSFALVYFMNARSDLLFGLPTPPAAC